MTAMPQLVAAFHSLVGLAAVLIAGAALWSPANYGLGAPGGIPVASLVEISRARRDWRDHVLGLGRGLCQAARAGLRARPAVQGAAPAQRRPAVGSGRLAGDLLPGESRVVFGALAAVALVMGLLVVLPIGGADMPVVVSMLNSYSGLAAAGIGFTLRNPLLIIAGALIAASGAILSYIMCRAMNRSILNVVFGGFGTGAAVAAAGAGERPVIAGSPEDAGHLLGHASSVIIVPGYGMARPRRSTPCGSWSRRWSAVASRCAMPFTPWRGGARPHERAAGRGQRAL